MSFLQLLLASFQPSEYPRLVGVKGAGLPFLAKWLLLTTGLSALALAAAVQMGTDALQEKLAAAPNFGLKDGKAWFDGPQPYRVEEPGQVVVVVDTTGKTAFDDLGDAPNALFVTATAMVSRDGQGKRELHFEDLKGLSLEKADLVRLVDLLPLLLIAWHVVLYGVWMFLAIAFALIGGAMATSASGGRLDRARGMKLAAHGFAIPMAIGTSPLSFPGLWMLVFATGALLTWLGARAVPPVERPPASPP